MTAWVTDVLGDDFQAMTIPLGEDEEGEVVATLVRYRPAGQRPLRRAQAVLYVHGWSDYFFQRGLAEFWHRQNAAFYAIDLRKYGRSLREGQTPGYTESLAVYDQEIDAALTQIAVDHGPGARTMLMGHSTGGLVVSMYAHRHPGAVNGLVLNSPWLEVQGSAWLRVVSTPAIEQLAKLQPKAAMISLDPGYYTRTLNDVGPWEYSTTWRPTPSFPVRPAWLAAVMEAHAEVAKGLDIDAPIIALLSRASHISPLWHEDMRRTDIVLDVRLLAQRAVQLGPVVTVVRIDGGIHDLALSAPGPRAVFYAQIERWCSAYAWA